MKALLQTAVALIVLIAIMGMAGNIDREYELNSGYYTAENK